MRELTDDQWQTVANNIPLIEAAARSVGTALGDYGEAYTVALDAMCEAVTTYDKARDASLKTWFNGLLRFRILTAIKRRYRRVAEEYPELLETSSGAEEVEVSDILSLLDDDLRALVIDIHYNRYTFQQCADRDGKTKAQVYAAYRRAVYKLRRVCA